MKPEKAQHVSALSPPTWRGLLLDLTVHGVLHSPACSSELAKEIAMSVIKASAAQLSPVFYSRGGTVERVVRKIHWLAADRRYSSPRSRRAYCRTRGPEAARLSFVTSSLVITTFWTSGSVMKPW